MNNSLRDFDPWWDNRSAIMNDEYDIEIEGERPLQHVPLRHLPLVPTGVPLADLIAHRRRELGLTLNQLEKRTGINTARLSRWEQGLDSPQRPERLTALARGLDLPPADLYVAAGLDLSGQLPSLRPYLRSKYGDSLPPAALKEIERFSARLAAKYGLNTGPAPGQDE